VSTDVELVHAALLARGWGAVAPALGLRYQSERHRQPCPIHGGKSDNLTLDVRDGRLSWICASTCGAGDVLAMIQSLRGCSFPAALREAADLAGVELGDGSDDPERRAQRERERIAYLASAQDANREPAESPGYPPASEVAELWDGAGSVTDDREVAAYLASRAIDPAGAASRGALRVVRPGQPLPRWARYRGSQAASRTWIETGHRILIRTWDHLGELRGVRAWRVGGDDETPKRLPPAGYSCAGLVWANALALDMVRGGYPGRLVVCEGEPDAVVHMVRGSYAVIGITSGSWTQAIADRIAFGSEVIIRTHRDAAGDKYAAHITATLGKRVEVWRRAA
jgi:hypothetical protein